MIPSSSAVSCSFRFSSDSRGFELKQNDQTVAKLERHGLWSPDFIATTPNRSWMIHRAGFWGNRAEIRDSASQQPIAEFKGGWGGKGSLLFSDGQAFFIMTREWWHPIWTVTTQTGQPVLQLHTQEKTADVMADVAVSEERVSLLILFTLYRVRQAEEAAAVAAASAS